jgi:hypothetical protein
LRLKPECFVENLLPAIINRKKRFVRRNEEKRLYNVSKKAAMKRYGTSE